MNNNININNIFGLFAERLRDIERSIERRSTGRNEHVPQLAEGTEGPSHGRHALTTLPSLPLPRRPITPVPAHPQSQSPFFKIPAELRLQIYRLLVSNRELHVDMRYTAWETSTPHSTKGVVPSSTRRWRWRASTCHRHPEAQVTSDRCGWGGPPPTACDEHDTPCGIGNEALTLLLACRLTYREAVQVLYAENTFHINTGALILFTDRLLPPSRSRAIASLIYHVTQESVLTYSKEHLGVEPGVPAYEALISRIPAAFPGLKSLQIVIANPRLVDGMFRTAQHEPLGAGHDRILPIDTFLVPVDTIVSAYAGQLKECVVILDPRVSHMLPSPTGMSSEGETVEGRYTQFWRSVPATETDGAGECGYWLRRVSLDKGAEGPLEASFGQLMTEMTAFVDLATAAGAH